MRVLVACEFSGVVRDAFIALGHDAWSCDLQPAETVGPHFQDSIWHVLAKPLWKWDLMIAHPPCDYLANSGVCHLHTDPDRWEKMKEGAQFFKALWLQDIPRIAIENPIMHKYAREEIGGMEPSQIIQPWMFGHKEQKATCLWLKNLPHLYETNNVRASTMRLPDNQRQRLHYLPPSPTRKNERSRTYRGIAEEMAYQWTNNLFP